MIMRKTINKIIDIISIIIYMCVLVMFAVVGFSVLGLFLLGLKVVVFDVMFWIKALTIFIVFLSVVMVGFLAANGCEKFYEWRYKRKCKR